MTREELARMVDAHDAVWNGWWPVLTALSDTEAQRPFVSSYPSVFATVAHMVVAEAFWQHRLDAGSLDTAPDAARDLVDLERAWRTLVADTSLQVRSDRQRHRPYGLSGGEAGAPSANHLSDEVETRALPPMFSTTISAGTLYHHRMAGGGGWGDPLERELEAVAHDVRNEKVTEGQALERYGVVLRDGIPDEKLSTKLRAHMRAGRKEEVA